MTTLTVYDLKHVKCMHNNDYTYEIVPFSFPHKIGKEICLLCIIDTIRTCVLVEIPIKIGSVEDHALTRIKCTQLSEQKHN